MNRELSSITIRPFRPDDATAVACLIGRDLREVNAKDYPPETIDSMVRHFTPDKLIEMSWQRQMFVADDGAEVVATGSLAGNWILTFFVAPKCHGRGVGKRLLAHLEELAASQGCKEAFVPAGFTAITFYRKHGYTDAADQSKATKDWIILSKKFEQTLGQCRDPV